MNRFSPVALTLLSFDATPARLPNGCELRFSYWQKQFGSRNRRRLRSREAAH